MEAKSHLALFFRLVDFYFFHVVCASELVDDQILITLFE
jgi:hypothetical protein